MDQEQDLEKLHVVILAGGENPRVGGPVPKQFLSWQGRPLVDWSLLAFQAVSAVAGIVLVVPEGSVEELTRRLVREKLNDRVLAVTAGGATRQESVFAGMSAMPADAEWVAVHDAVRPFVTPQLIQATFSLAQQAGAAVPTVSIHDTLVQVDESGMLVRPISREFVKRSQTPQIFKSEMLAEAHAHAQTQGLVFADDAMLVRHYGYEVATFVHHGENRKISTPQDMEKITMQKSDHSLTVRVGQGFARQPFAAPENEHALVLAGVRFAAERGLDGFGDGDVVTQAVGDALLGAAGLGDWAQAFPGSDPAYQKVSSLLLLQDVNEKIRRRGLAIGYIDATLVGEHTRIGSRRETMRETLAAALSIDPECLSIKNVSSLSRLGGREEDGLAALAIATLTPAAE